MTPAVWRLSIASGFVIMWTSGFIGAELGTVSASALTLLTWRFLLLAPLAGLWLLLRGRIGPGDLTRQILIGALAQAGYLFGVVQAASWGVSAGTSALIAALQPIVATVAAGTMLGESTSPRRLAGLGIGLLGTFIVVSGEVNPQTPWWAYIFPMGAMLSLVAATIAERRFYRHRPAVGLLDALAVQCLTSAVLFGVVTAFTAAPAPPADTSFWLAVAWVIVLSTIGGYGCYWLCVDHLGVSATSSLLYLTPPVAAVWAWLMFGQPITPATLVGMVVCAVAVALVIGVRRSAGTAQHPTATAQDTDGAMATPPR